jgi:hypothetical protein
VLHFLSPQERAQGCDQEKKRSIEENPLSIPQMKNKRKKRKKRTKRRKQRKERKDRYRKKKGEKRRPNYNETHL